MPWKWSRGVKVRENLVMVADYVCDSDTGDAHKGVETDK
jgi:hypothetical protein